MGSLAALTLASCAGGTSVATKSPTPITGGLSQGLIAYVGDQGVGVLDPATGKATILAPLPGGGAFRIAGPVWGPAPGVAYPVLYFTLHDDRTAATLGFGGAPIEGPTHLSQLVPLEPQAISCSPDRRPKQVAILAFEQRDVAAIVLL